MIEYKDIYIRPLDSKKNLIRPVVSAAVFLFQPSCFGFSFYGPVILAGLRSRHL